MPIVFYTSGEVNYFIAVWMGSISDDDIFTAYEKLFSEDSWITKPNELADFSRASLAAVSNTGLERFAGYTRSIFRRHGIRSFHTAIYAPDDLAYGLSRMYEFYSNQGPETARVFRAKENAINWLTRK